MCRLCSAWSPEAFGRLHAQVDGQKTWEGIPKDDLVLLSTATAAKREIPLIPKSEWLAFWAQHKQDSLVRERANKAAELQTKKAMAREKEEEKDKLNNRLHCRMTVAARAASMRVLGGACVVGRAVRADGRAD